MPEEEYNLANWDFIRNYEKPANRKIRVDITADRYRKRYILIERIR